MTRIAKNDNIIDYFFEANIISMRDTVQWEGVSGEAYEFEINVWPYDTEVSGPGSFILARLSSRGLWDPVYIGGADDLADLDLSNRSLNCIKNCNATHIHIRFNEDEKTAIREEKDLIQNHEPICND